MYTNQRPRDWEYIINDCQPKLILIQNEKLYKKFIKSVPLFESLNILILEDAKHLRNTISYHAKNSQLKFTPSEKPAKDDCATIIYTSGTTGSPKGVMLSHANIISQCDAIEQALPINEKDCTLSFLPWAHIYGQITELHAPFRLGHSVAFAENNQKILKNIKEISPTILVGVPRVFQLIYNGIIQKMSSKPAWIQQLFSDAIQIDTNKRMGQRLTTSEVIKLSVADRLIFHKIRQNFGGRIRFAISGAAALDKDIARLLDTVKIKIYEGYGMTETSPLISVNTPAHRKIGSVGRPFSHVELDIQPIAGRDEGEGEIIAYGSGVMLGYYKLPEENNRVFTKDGGLRTGDIGRVDSQGYLHITGRIKEQYKMENGRYVVPSSIEKSITKSLLVDNCILYGDNRPFNVAVIDPNRDEIIDWANSKNLNYQSYEDLLDKPELRHQIEIDIRQLCNDTLSHEKPRRVILSKESWSIENGYITPSLKPRRHMVLNTHNREIEAAYSGLTPVPTR